MKRLDTKTTTYSLNNGFRVDIVENGANREAWIYHRDYCTKLFMFGIESDMSHAEFLQSVELSYKDYLTNYQQEVMD